MENRLEGAVVFISTEESGARLMLEPVVFAPPAQWAVHALTEAGVSRFLVVCRSEDRDAAGACFPADATYILLGQEDAQEKLKEFLEHIQGRVVFFTKPVLFFRQAAEQMAQPGALPKGKCTSGAWRAEGKALAAALEARGDLPGALAETGESLDPLVTVLGDDFVSRAAAQETGRRLTAAWWMERGVTLLNHDATYLSPTVTVGQGTTILPGTILRGDTRVGKGCEVGPDTVLTDVTVGDDTVVNSSQCLQCSIGSRCTVGPFAYLRPNTQVGDGVRIGDFVELKNSTVGDGTKISHLSYVGDSDVGARINIGCGAVTVNYDGKKKFRTRIGDGAFIGCNTNLVAPVTVGSGSYVAAGSTITSDVPADSLAIARSEQTVKNQWARKRRGRE